MWQRKELNLGSWRGDGREDEIQVFSCRADPFQDAGKKA